MGKKYHEKPPSIPRFLPPMATLRFRQPAQVAANPTSPQSGESASLGGRRRGLSVGQKLAIGTISVVTFQITWSGGLGSWTFASSVPAGDATSAQVSARNRHP